MSDEPKKNRRRRRRPRSSNRNKTAGSGQNAQSASGTSKPASSRGRRGRSRRRNPNAAKKNEARGSKDELTIQRHTEKSISPINKDIFIYTYTLRPRSLLDSYQSGPNIAEKMTFEQPDKPYLSD